MAKPKKTYKDYLEDAIKAKERADKALEALALRIGKDVLKTDSKIESFKDYESRFKAVYLKVVESAKATEKDLQKMQNGQEEVPEYKEQPTEQSPVGYNHYGQ